MSEPGSRAVGGERMKRAADVAPGPHPPSPARARPPVGDGEPEGDWHPEGDRHPEGPWWPGGDGRPEGVWFAPGRVNLLGGPDYNEVLVLPFALAAGVRVAASRRRDGRICVTSRQAGAGPVVLPVAALSPGSVSGWAALVAGVAWALREAGYLAGGAEVAIDADLPMGAGLSSSAALACSVALALTGLYGLSLPRHELAALARRAETGFIGVPTGIMDQLAALRGRAGHALLLDCRSRSATAIPFDPAGAGLALLIIDTRVRRSLADTRYAARRRDCQDAAAKLGVRSLRDIAASAGAPASLTEPLVSLTEPLLRRRAGHVIAEYRRVLAAAELLRRGRPAGIGGLLTASHFSLRDEFEVSWPQADVAVDAATGAGAIGARMTGGGFGGCVVALVPVDRIHQVSGAVNERFAQQRWPAPHYLDAAPSGAARRLA